MNLWATGALARAGRFGKEAVMITQEQQSIVDHAQLQKINGWQHIKVKGTPYECGFQEGYLLADEYKDALRVYKFMTLESFGMDYDWFAEQSLKLHRDKIPTRWLEELRGMAEGLTAAGIPTTTDAPECRQGHEPPAHEDPPQGALLGHCSHRLGHRGRQALPRPRELR